MTAVQMLQPLKAVWRMIFLADGTHISMLDTQENQAAYPQLVVQQPRIGFSLARPAVLRSLATGASLGSSPITS